MARAREVSVRLEDGTELHLRLDFNAMARIEEQTGEPMVGGYDVEADAKPKRGKKAKGHSFSAKETRILVWACAAAYDEARDQEPTYSLTQIGSRMSIKDITVLALAIAELSAANLPDVPLVDPEARAEAGPPPAPLDA